MRTVVFITLLGSLFVEAQDKQIKRVPIAPTSPASGKAMFGEYCAVCHGLEGTGNGPAAAALKDKPADLTALSSKNGGKFPEAHVYTTLRQVESPIHSSKRMPVWGNLFYSITTNPAEMQMRINNLVSYVRSLQKSTVLASSHAAADDAAAGR